MYGIGFRKHVMRVKEEEGLTFRVLSKRFRVGVATLVRWSKRIEPMKQRDRRRKVSAEELMEDVRRHPDAYQSERAKRFGVSQNAIFYGLQKIGISYKKNDRASESGRKRKAILSGEGL